MRRGYGLMVLPLITLACACCSPPHEDRVEMAKAALSLSVEHHMHSCTHAYNCPGQSLLFGLNKPVVRSTLIAIPLNKEILESAVNYRCITERLTPRELEALKRRTEEKYLLGNQAVFVLVVHNTTRNIKSSTIGFRNISSDVVLKDEQGQVYTINDYTHIFDEELLENMSSGYIYFDGFQITGSHSYSIHLSGYSANPCIAGARADPNVQPWAFAFDESEVGFLKLLGDGLEEKFLREQYNSSAQLTDVLSPTDILEVIGFVVKAVLVVSK